MVVQVNKKPEEAQYPRVNDFLLLDDVWIAERKLAARLMHIGEELVSRNAEDKVMSMSADAKPVNLLSYMLYAMIASKVRDPNGDYYMAYVKHANEYEYSDP